MLLCTRSCFIVLQGSKNDKTGGTTITVVVQSYHFLTAFSSWPIVHCFVLMCFYRLLVKLSLMTAEACKCKAGLSPCVADFA